MNKTPSRELTQDELQKVLDTVDIPSCPAVVADALGESQKDEPDIRRLAEIIANDPGMAAAAMKLANSALFGNGNKVTSVRQAVERLGIKNVVCVVIAAGLRASITGLPAAWLEQFWKRSTQLAVVAAMIARRLYGISPDAAYTYTLFHDAAIPLMMKRYPNYGEVIEHCQTSGKLLAEAEAEFFPCSHPVVGSLLVRNWGLPQILGQAIRFHHEQDAYDLPDSTLPGGALSFIAVTQVAEHLVAEVQDMGDLEVGPELFGRALAYLGISTDDMDDLRHRVAQVLEGA